MQTHHLNPGEDGEAERRAQLAAAARALRAWVNTRDADRSHDLPTPAAIAAPAAPRRAPVAAADVAAALPAPSAASVEGPAPVTDRALFGSFESTPAVRLPRFELPDFKRIPALPRIPWSRNASVATAAGLILLVVAGAIYANRTTFANTWSSLMSAGSEVLEPAMGSIVFESVPEAAQVSVGDNEIGMTPITTELAEGRHMVTFSRAGETRVLEVDVVAGELVQSRIDWAAPRTGHLRVDSTPPGATVVIGGRDRGVTPLTIENLPVGTHELLLRGPSGTVEGRVTITADRTAEVSEAIYSGFVHVSAPFELVITRDGRRIRLDEQNQLLLPPGVHRLTFANADLNFSVVRQVEVTPGGRTQVAIVPEPTTLTITATQPAEVFLNGERIGETSIVSHSLPIGTHQVLVRSLISGVARQTTVTATPEPVTLAIDFAAPEVPPESSAAAGTEPITPIGSPNDQLTR